MRLSPKVALLSTSAALGAVIIASPASAASPQIGVSPENSRLAVPGPPENFTGQVQSRSLFGATDHLEASGGEVSFEPHARTAWHTHPAGQTLIVTEGTGWVQEWGGPKQVMSVGDVVTIAPGVKHWHGATALDAMTHIAIAEAIDGSRVTWMEHVGPDQYYL